METKHKILGVRRSSLIRKSSPDEYFHSNSETATELKQKIKKERNQRNN